MWLERTYVRLRAAAISFFPTSFPTRMVPAADIPKAAMNEMEARFRAIWWAAKATVPRADTTRTYASMPRRKMSWSREASSRVSTGKSTSGLQARKVG